MCVVFQENVRAHLEAELGLGKPQPARCVRSIGDEACGLLREIDGDGLLDTPDRRRGETEEDGDPEEALDDEVRSGNEVENADYGNGREFLDVSFDGF